MQYNKHYEYISSIQSLILFYYTLMCIMINRHFKRFIHQQMKLILCNNKDYLIY